VVCGVGATCSGVLCSSPACNAGLGCTSLPLNCHSC
jgi:hypothetical protein